MFSLMRLTPDAHGFVVSYPFAAGASLVALAIALVIFAVARRTPLKRRWPVYAAVLVAGWSGLYFVSFRATVTPHGAAVYAFMQLDREMPWREATEVYAAGAAGNAHIVLVGRDRRALEMNVADLAVEDRERLLGYMRARIGPGVVERVQRPAPARGHRLFAEQQI